MPCNYYGKIIPGDRASCIAGGGTWVSEPSLMSDPTTGQGIPMTGTTEEPMENLTAYMIPGVGATSKVASKAAPLAKRGAQALVSKPGTVQKTVPKLKKLADGTVKQVGTKTVDKAGRVLSVPRASATAIGATSLFNQATSPNPYEGQTGPVKDKTVVPPIVDDTKDITPSGEDIQKMGKKGKIPKGLLDRMGTKDYWLKGMEGGSGGWDNRLFRLGEMMSYMGTPLSKRGDNPAKRWTSASTAADKLKAEIAKAGNKKPGSIFGKIPTQTAKDTVMSELKKEPWFLGFGQQFNDEELEAMGNKGEMIYIEWMENGATATQALEETLKELKLGL